MAMGSKSRIKIVRRRVVRVSRELLNLFENPELIQHYCWSCNAPKVCPKQKCELCGLNGTVSPLHYRRSHIFVEFVKQN